MNETLTKQNHLSEMDICLLKRSIVRAIENSTKSEQLARRVHSACHVFKYINRLNRSENDVNEQPCLFEYDICHLKEAVLSSIEQTQKQSIEQHCRTACEVFQFINCFNERYANLDVSFTDEDD
ncbi:hypothetical protein B0187_00725 [Haemophilus paracuniculus]|uniref:Uncharacterized protein n=1 Tax=Haemophilus paracuniculus TaxID=734 RepID=A0A1T0AVM9_9PAST|nr:hypothetical protein [Haemophilus paracuniculus]OOS00849.1 hypothetical protein B0187_00725 [Haemophilus paracuniculus]